MSDDKLSASFSIKAQKIPLNEHMLKTTRLEVFPLVSLRFQKDTKKEDYSLTVKVGTKLFDYLVRGSYTDEMLLYSSPSTDQIGFWTPDMVLGFQLLSALGIIEDIKSWIIAARGSLTKFLLNEKVDAAKKNSEALEKARELLKSIELVNIVDSNSLMPMLIKNMIDSRKMDPTTIIFRLAMAIYHAKNATDQTVVSEVEDPSTLFLKLTQSEYFKKNEKELKILTDLPAVGVNQVMKFIVVMTIAAFVYYKTVGSEK